MIIYPETRSGFDKVFARIHINNANPKGSEGQYFFASYQIKSQKEKNAILISPHNLPSFLEDLKVLVELGYDAMFKLTQCQQGDTIQKFVEITGSSGPAKEKETVRSFVQIDAHFDKALFPEEIEPKAIEFGIDSNTCNNVLSKFRSRLQILNDDTATLSFKTGEDTFSMQLKSKHMRTNVTNRGYPAKPKDPAEVRPKYKVMLKKEVFLKFFMILKLAT